METLEIVTTDEFWGCVSRESSPKVRKLAFATYNKLMKNGLKGSNLQFERLHQAKADLYTVRAGKGPRIVGLKADGKFILLHIDSHDDAHRWAARQPRDINFRPAPIAQSGLEVAFDIDEEFNPSNENPTEAGESDNIEKEEDAALSALAELEQETLRNLNQAIAYSDQAKSERDQAKAEGDRTKAERDQAKTERDQAKTERDQAKAERDRTKAERDQAKAERDQAKAEGDRTKAERDQAKAERDQAKAERDHMFEVASELEDASRQVSDQKKKDEDRRNKAIIEAQEDTISLIEAERDEARDERDQAKAERNDLEISFRSQIKSLQSAQSFKSSKTSLSAAPCHAALTIARSKRRFGEKIPGVSTKIIWASSCMAMPRMRLLVV